jgi:hypothetical protein
MQLILFSSNSLLCSNLLFVIINKSQFLVNSEIYHIDTRQDTNFQQPSVNLTKYQKEMSYLGVMVYNKLPTYVKIESDNPKEFNSVLQ